MSALRTTVIGGILLMRYACAGPTGALPLGVWALRWTGIERGDRQDWAMLGRRTPVGDRTVVAGCVLNP